MSRRIPSRSITAHDDRKIDLSPQFLERDTGRNPKDTGGLGFRHDRDTPTRQKALKLSQRLAYPLGIRLGNQAGDLKTNCVIHGG